MRMIMTLFRIDPEFAKLLPPQTEEENRLLLNKIKDEGCNDGSIVVANINGEHLLIDGHHTYELCGHLNKPIGRIKIIPFANRELAIEWIINNQLARRNLTDEQRAYYIGKK